MNFGQNPLGLQIQFLIEAEFLKVNRILWFNDEKLSDDLYSCYNKYLSESFPNFCGPQPQLLDYF